MTSRVYASIDRNICATRLRPGMDFLQLDGDEELVNLEGHKNVFPHAVLQVRWEGDAPRWLEELNGSHLLERVNGFSIYAHAVAMLVPSEVPKLPSWLPLLQKDIRKLQPAQPSSVRRRDSASPFVTTDSKTSSSIENNRPCIAIETQPSSVAPSIKAPSPRKKRRSPRKGYGTSSPTSPVIYWSEFENPREEPFTVPVDETTSLLPWFQRNSRRDLEAQRDAPVVSVFRKLCGAVEMEVKTSADGLTTLFYEKQDIETSEEEDSVSEDSSPTSAGYTRRPRRWKPEEDKTRMQLLNRGYCLCVVGCTIILSIFGVVGLLLNGQAAGICFAFVGFLIAMTLEIVSMVRFIM
jgi:hypothetical protein